MKLLHADIKPFLLVLGALALIFAVGLCPVWQDCAAAPIQNPDAQAAYSRVKSGYDSLVKSSILRTQVMEWQKMIREFRAIYFKYPDDPDVTPKILYMMARCYNNLYDNSKSGDDLEEAIKRYEVLVERFPDNRLADDALYLLSGLYLTKGDAPAAQKSLERIIEQYPYGDQVDKARKGLASLRDNEAVAGMPAKAETSAHQNPHDTDKQPPPVSAGKTHENIGDTSHAGPASESPVLEAAAAMHEVTDIRHWSVSDYTRIVIDTTGPVTFKEGFLPANKPKGLLPRFYIDIRPAVMKKGLPSAIDIRDGLLKGVRAAQFDKNTVRVVCDLGGSRKIKAFYLEDPFRVIIDAFSEQYAKGTLCPVNKNAIKQKVPEGPPVKANNAVKGEIKGNKLSITQQLGLCVRRVVIDPGHGGKDPGAIGPEGLQEKDVTLRIANKVAEKLKDELGCEVILTRHDDVFLPLEQRTAIANAKKADLFVSIHTNAAPNPAASGVETYFLNFAVNEDAMRVAALENATSSKRVGELQSILNNILKNAKVNESSRLAAFVQKDIINALNLNGRFGDIKSLGVKQAPFFVLIGAQMPSILVETSFISNPKEETFLKDGGYLDRIADGIVSGIKAYSKDINFASSASVR